MKAFLYASLLALACAATSAQAQDHGGRGHGGGGGGHDGPHAAAGPGPGGRGPAMGPGPGGPRHFAGDFGRFGPDDRAMWMGGGWRHEYRDGRWGWWWLVDGMWYWYDQPIYPYPTVVSVVTYTPPPEPMVYASQEPAAPVAAPPRFRYFCPDRGYYPQVQNCPVDFVREPIP